MNVNTNTTFTSTPIRDLPKEVDDRLKVYESKLKDVFDRWELNLKCGLTPNDIIRLKEEIALSIVFQEKK